jgi:hypothetical protein
MLPGLSEKMHGVSLKSYLSTVIHSRKTHKVGLQFTAVSPEQEVATRKSEMMPGAGVHPEDSAKVARLIASGDTSAAVEAAKKIHKRVKNAASEALLVDAYIARIPALIERKLEVEARNLMEHVRDRYPASRERLKEIKPLFSVRKAELDALLQPLNDPSLSEEKRATIYKTITYQVGDLGCWPNVRLFRLNILCERQPQRSQRRWRQSPAGRLMIRP